MSSYNKVILLGNATRAPELRHTPGGQAICKFSLAVNRNYAGPNGEKKTETTFVDVDAFGKPAETLGKYLTKGKPLLVEGRLKLDTWEKNGEKRSRLGVVLEGFQFMDGGQRTEAPRGSHGPATEEDYNGRGD